jgi:Saxitoxin biosynthesis operon protein SxtJ
MQWSDIQFRPNTTTLRQFAGLWLVCFGVLALWEGLARRHPTAGVVLVLLAVGVGVPGLIWPQLTRPIYVAWMVLAFPIGWTVSQLIVALLFYGLFTPIGLVFRLIGRDPLHRARQPGLETYWSAKLTPTDPRRYFKQF